MFSDKRLDGFPLMNSPLAIVIICIAYLIVAKIWGPKLMEKRPAFKLRGVLMVYNSLQVIFNGLLFYQICRLTWFSGYSFICQPVNYSDAGEPFQILMIGYCFYVLKFVDFLDTLFFILRKKKKSNYFPSSLSSRHNADKCLSLLAFCRWRTRQFCPHFQYFCALRNVHLLSDVSHGARLPEILMVEKIFDHFTISPIFLRCTAQLSAYVYRLRLPCGLCLVDGHTAVLILSTFQKVLFGNVQKK